MTKELEILSHENVMFCLHGEVEATADGAPVDLGPVKERCMIVPLLLSKGKAVSRLELTDWMWDGDAPENARDELDHHMTNFRRRLTAMGFRQPLVNRNGVCRLRIPPEQVDVHRFGTLVAEAKQLDDQAAAERLRTALDLCAGEPLAGLPGRRIDSCRHALLEERRNAEIALIRVEFRLGRAERHVPDLVRLSRERLADTDVVGLAMFALHLTGRQAEAVALYHRYREHLVELGMSVPKRMLDLQTRIMRNDTGFDPEQEDFPLGGSSESPKAGREKADGKKPRKAAPKVVNKVSGTVTGDYIVFGVDNRKP